MFGAVAKRPSRPKERNGTMNKFCREEDYKNRKAVAAEYPAAEKIRKVCGGNQVFNFDDGITVGFDFFDLCEILKVFRGFDESMCYGKGLFHHTSAAAFRINLTHRIEIDCGYEFEVIRKDRADGTERTIRIKLTNTEALGICTAIEQSLTMIAF